MSSQYADYEKTGYKKMLDLAKTLCRLVTTWEVVIRAKFPDSLPILALLDAIKALCLLLPEADEAFTALTVVSTPPADTSEETGGYDPSAEPTQPPDLT